MTEETEYPDPGEVPVLDWIDVALIGVEACYQRPLDTARVESIARSFSWRSFGALVVVPQQDGTYHATDGQHRLEAAKLHPKVTHVPCCIVTAEDIRSEAGIFVDINKNRKNVNALELFFAELTAGDEDAETILQVCQKAGVRIPKYAGKGFKPGDTIAISAIQGLIDRRHAMRARQILEILAKADLTPITAAQVKATEMILHDDEFAGQVDIEDLAVVVKSLGPVSDIDAKRFAAAHGVPFWRALANVWFQKCRKRRAPRAA